MVQSDFVGQLRIEDVKLGVSCIHVTLSVKIAGDVVVNLTINSEAVRGSSTGLSLACITDVFCAKGNKGDRIVVLSNKLMEIFVGFVLRVDEQIFEEIGVSAFILVNLDLSLSATDCVLALHCLFFRKMQRLTILAPFRELSA